MFLRKKKKIPIHIEIQGFHRLKMNLSFSVTCSILCALFIGVFSSLEFRLDCVGVSICLHELGPKINVYICIQIFRWQTPSQLKYASIVRNFIRFTSCSRKNEKMDRKYCSQEGHPESTCVKKWERNLFKRLITLM